MSDEAWIALGADLPDADYNAEFKARAGIDLRGGARWASPEGSGTLLQILRSRWEGTPKPPFIRNEHTTRHRGCGWLPGPREVLVRTAAAGCAIPICTSRTGPTPTPTAILGQVRGRGGSGGGHGDLREAWDHVITCLSAFCGHCEHCLTGHILCDPGAAPGAAMSRAHPTRKPAPPCTSS